MIRVRTGSRLHFGLLSLPSGDPAHAPSRVWGGAGLMVQQPGFDLEARPAPAWSAAGPLAARVLQIINRFVQSLPPDASPPHHLHFQCHTEVRQHQGLGSGTQLALAVARILAELYVLPDRSAPALAQRIGRGLRSALGIHGFDHGGFLVDGGKTHAERVAPLVARADFPDDWRAVLILFKEGTGMHGSDEVQAFQQLQRQRLSLDTESLSRLVLMGMLPALVEKDLNAFGGALYEFNRRVGEGFRPVQGGVYAHPQAADIVAYLRSQGVAGAGQSSWGPGLFAMVEDEERARQLALRLCQARALRDEDVLITRAAHSGAQVDHAAE